MSKILVFNLLLKSKIKQIPSFSEKQEGKGHKSDKMELDIELDIDVDCTT